MGNKELLIHSKSLSNCKRYKTMLQAAEISSKKVESQPEENIEPTPCDFVEVALGNTEMFECQDCGKEFSKRENLLRHAAIHTSKHKCDTCGKTFVEKRRLMIHNKSQVNCVRYMNSLMPDLALSASAKKGAKRQQEEEPKEDVVKPKTTTKFADVKKEKIELEKNVPLRNSEHDDQNGFNCDICDKVFVNKKRLYEHKILHTDRYKCSTCHHRFTRKNDLEKHCSNLDNCNKFLDDSNEPGPIIPNVRDIKKEHIIKREKEAFKSIKKENLKDNRSPVRKEQTIKKESNIKKENIVKNEKVEDSNKTE